MVFKKIIFQNSYVALETPTRPPPFMANAILNFHFDFQTPSLTYSHVVVAFLPKFAAAGRQLFYRFSNPYNENLLQVTYTYSRTPDAGSPHESDHSMYQQIAVQYFFDVLWVVRFRLVGQLTKYVLAHYLAMCLGESKEGQNLSHGLLQERVKRQKFKTAFAIRRRTHLP